MERRRDERGRGRSPAFAKLTLSSSDRTRAVYPWDFALAATVSLRGACLRISVRVENTGDRALPYAFGAHPYFAVKDKAHARIPTSATRAYDNVKKHVVPFGGFDFTAPEVDMHLIDHGQTEGTLALGDGSAITVRGSPELRRWVVWTVSGKDFVCLEPWSAPGNALNTGRTSRFCRRASPASPGSRSSSPRAEVARRACQAPFQAPAGSVSCFLVRPLRGILAAGWIVASLWASRPACAQTSDSVTAQALFDEGKRLMQGGHFADACPKLVESQRLNPGGGTLLAIGLCYEGQGRIASAWANFNLALSEARREHRPEREALAEQHIKALEPRLLRVRVVPLERSPGLQVRRGDEIIGDAQWGVPVPIDAGRYHFAASAPGKQGWEEDADLTGEGKTIDVSIPALANAAIVPSPLREPPPQVLPVPPPAPPPPSRRLADALGGCGYPVVSGSSRSASAPG